MDEPQRGDEIITAGGIHGTVRRSTTTSVDVEIAPGRQCASTGGRSPRSAADEETAGAEAKPEERNEPDLARPKASLSRLLRVSATDVHT